MTTLDRPSRPWPPVRIAQWVTVAALLVVSEVLSWLGHAATSWALDAAAVCALVGFTLARRMGAGRG